MRDDDEFPDWRIRYGWAELMTDSNDKNDSTLSASQEDYLEAIYEVVEAKGAVRSKDLAKRLNVGASSVTGALRVLSEKGFINYAPYDVITLTKQGRLIASDISSRHEAILEFFVKVLGLPKNEAGEVACKMEHMLSPSIMLRLTQFVDFTSVCPRGGQNWLDSFRYYCQHGTLNEDCAECFSEPDQDKNPQQDS